MVIKLLCESSGIRAISRLTGLHQQTVLKILKLSGQLSNLCMNEKIKNVKCEVIQDLTEIPMETQVKVLEMSGNFWSPRNPTGSYIKLPITQLPRSPWVDYYWSLPPSHREVLVMPEYLTEIAFAREIQTNARKKE